MIKENKKDERLKNGTNHGYKVYVQWTTVHVGVLFFFFFLSIEQYVLFDIFQLNLSRTCVVSLWFTYP
jgi:hypothetical protein